MNENSQYVVGIDIGTDSIKCVVASLNDEMQPTIVGVGEAGNHSETAVAEVEQMIGDEPPRLLVVEADGRQACVE